MNPAQVLEEISGALHGTKATRNDIKFLKTSLPKNLMPNWLVLLLSEYNLAGSAFSLDRKEDQSGLGAEVIWLLPIQLVSEAYDSEPGISVRSLGFVAIGACATGSGDPYFLDMRMASNDPPVVRVPHDCRSRRLSIGQN
ncbi:MAG TPA: hypothetical protein VK148_23655 [Xanthobacteraceae bacterium]|jgi:hypothetical protein|nr:hypothetical protein [Xanthobacteraceae bacterium]